MSETPTTTAAAAAATTTTKKTMNMRRATSRSGGDAMRVKRFWTMFLEQYRMTDLQHSTLNHNDHNVDNIAVDRITLSQLRKHAFGGVPSHMRRDVWTIMSGIRGDTKLQQTIASHLLMSLRSSVGVQDHINLELSSSPQLQGNDVDLIKTIILSMCCGYSLQKKQQHDDDEDEQQSTPTVEWVLGGGESSGFRPGIVQLAALLMHQCSRKTTQNSNDDDGICMIAKHEEEGDRCIVEKLGHVLLMETEMYLRDQQVALRRDALVIAQLLVEDAPQLAKHFNTHQFDVVDLADIITSWTTPMFLYVFPNLWVIRILDLLYFQMLLDRIQLLSLTQTSASSLCTGPGAVLVPVYVALFEHFQDKLIAAKDRVELYSIIHSIPVCMHQQVHVIDQVLRAAYFIAQQNHRLSELISNKSWLPTMDREGLPQFVIGVGTISLINDTKQEQQQKSILLFKNAMDSFPQQQQLTDEIVDSIRSSIDGGSKSVLNELDSELDNNASDDNINENERVVDTIRVRLDTSNDMDALRRELEQERDRRVKAETDLHQIKLTSNSNPKTALSKLNDSASNRVCLLWKRLKMIV